MRNHVYYMLFSISILALVLLNHIYINLVNAQQVAINGAGATFPFPLIDTWRIEYKKVNPDVNVNLLLLAVGVE